MRITSRRGFTLIELLVVIAVIALLLGILLPALSTSRQMGKATKCIAHMRGLCTAALMYTDNNDGRLPAVGLSHGGSVDEGNAWINSAAQEIGNEKVTLCPSDESRYWQTPWGSTGQYRRMSYATNYCTVGSLEGLEEFNVLTRITKPSTTIFLGELTDDGEFAVADHFHPETWFANPAVLAAKELALKRHLKKSNWGFLDGHVEPLKFQLAYDINFAASSFPNIAWIHNKFDPRVAW